MFTTGWSAWTFVLAPRGLLLPTPKESFTTFLLPSSVASHWLLLLALFWQAELSSSHSSTSFSSFSITFSPSLSPFLPRSLVIWQLCCFLSLARKEDGGSKRRLEKTSQDFFVTALPPPCPPTPPPPHSLFKTVWSVHSLTQIQFDVRRLCARA